MHDGTLRIDRHVVYSWMWLCPRDTLQREMKHYMHIMQNSRKDFTHCLRHSFPDGPFHCTPRLFLFIRLRCWRRSWISNFQKWILRAGQLQWWICRPTML